MLSYQSIDERNQAGGGNNLQGNKSTEAAYYRLALLFQFRLRPALPRVKVATFGWPNSTPASRMRPSKFDFSVATCTAYIELMAVTVNIRRFDFCAPVILLGIPQTLMALNLVVILLLCCIYFLGLLHIA